MNNCYLAKICDVIQEELWYWIQQKFGVETVCRCAVIVIVLILGIIFLEKLTNIFANVKKLFPSESRDRGSENSVDASTNSVESERVNESEFSSADGNEEQAANGNDEGTHTVALSIETQLVDRNVKKIKEQFSATKSDPKEILTLFSKLKDGLICANDAPSYEMAKEMIFGGKWDSLYGKMPEIYRCILRNLNSYSGAGRIYYEKCAEEAKSNGVSEQVVQDGIWDELSSEQQLPILLYGALNREFDLPRPSTLTKGKDGSFYSFVGGTPWAKHFDVATLLYLLFAENPNPIRDIVEKAHASK